MLVKVLDENRVKILMEDNDIEFYDLPFEKLNYDDPLSRAFIYELIQKTYDQTGVDFMDCRVMIEVIPGVSRAYYILLTKIEQEGQEQFEFDKADKAEAETYIFKLNHGTEVLRFFKCLCEFDPESSELYYYNQKYYITLSFSPAVTVDPKFGLLLNRLEEYGGRVLYNYTNEAFLKEWGELLVGGDACGTLS
jgi:negative regulator of genetic competence, sporulation and motility